MDDWTLDPSLYEGHTEGPWRFDGDASDGEARRLRSLKNIDVLIASGWDEAGARCSVTMDACRADAALLEDAPNLLALAIQLKTALELIASGNGKDKVTDADREWAREEFDRLIHGKKPPKSEFQRIKEERDRLREALTACERVLGFMPDEALRIGLGGTSDWDRLAGTHDLFGALDAARAALAEGETDDR